MHRYSLLIYCIYDVQKNIHYRKQRYDYEQFKNVLMA